MRGRTFVAEGHPAPGEFLFTLFEVVARDAVLRHEFSEGANFLFIVRSRVLVDIYVFGSL